jgi:hypothetical protein
MRTIIHRVFSRGSGDAPASRLGASSGLTSSDIENYYLRIVLDCLERMLVPADVVDVAVRRTGRGPNGLRAYAGYVRLLRWDPVVAPVLLQNIPAIDARIRKMVAASVILEHTHFAGLWFQATSATPGAPTGLVGLPAELMRRPGSD